MNAIVMTALSGWRRRWLGSVALVLLLGLAGGAVMAAAAGARRTETAYDRYLRDANSTQLLVSPYDDSIQGLYDNMLGHNGIVNIARFSAFTLLPTRPHHPLAAVYPVNVGADRQFLYEVERPRLLHGRLPDPARFDEIAVNPTFSSAYRIRAGDKIEMAALNNDADPTAPLPPGAGERITMTVTGVVVARSDVVPVGQYDVFPHLYGTPPLYRHLSGRFSVDFSGAYVTLKPGTDRAPAMARFAKRGSDLGSGAVTLDNSRDQAVINRAIRPQATALQAFALLLGVVSALVFGQLIVRQTQLESGEDATLRAIGMRRRQIVAIAALRGLALAAAAAASAVAVAIAASGFAPIGPARAAERHAGIVIHLAIIGSGATGIIASVVAAVALTAWRSTSQHVARRPGTRPRAGRIVTTTSRLPWPSVSLGTQFALGPRQGRAIVPVRTAIGALALALAAITGTIVFTDSLHHLVSTPAAYGQDWDLSLDAGFNFPPAPAVLDELGHDAAVDAIAGGRYVDLVVNGKAISGIALEDLKGDTFPKLVEGRAPSGPSEIALGSKTLGAVGAQVGSLVQVDAGEGRHPFRVVGRVVFPQLARGSFTALGLGVGAIVRPTALPTTTLAFPSGVPDDVKRTVALPDGRFYNFLTLRLPAHRAGRAAAAAKMKHIASGEVFINERQRPAAVSNSSPVQATLAVLTGILGLLVAGILAIILVTMVRQRRHDLAICQAIGVDRRGIRAIIAWQVTTVAVIGAGFGIPLGIAAGRLAWEAYARNLGVPPAPLVPLIALAGIAVAALALANVTAIIPASITARWAPAAALHTE
ncbi:MAG TPA: FtsX-like permease family protein [bacterium]|nr:FtsX-like permease family protein [bacterium]